MKNVVNTLLRNIYYKIPNEILTEAFRKVMMNSNRTLDSVIKQHIIIDIVLMNCNLYAGKTKSLVLYENYGKQIDDKMLMAAFDGCYGVYTIPPEARENRPITAVLDIAYPTTLALYGVFPNTASVGRSVTNGIDQALGSFTHTPAYTTPVPMLIDGDAGIIQLSPPAAVHVDWVLSCMLAYDKEFANISLNMLPSLRDMVEYATKAYIHNALFIQLNQGYLQGGLQLEAIRGTIESYSTANDIFEEKLRKFRGASNFSQDAFRNLMSLMIGG